MPELRTRIADLRESLARNNQAVSLYTWKPLKSFSKTRTRKTEHPEVRQSPDGKPVKTSLDPPAAAQQQT
jgi:hypothetical protein